GGATLGYLLAFGGYSGTAPEQSDGTQLAIRAAAGALPVLCVLLAAVAVWFYPLTDARFRDIVAELAERETPEEKRARPTEEPGPA
ncbi:MFS transporter, partial [Streptomyces sp. TRM76130]|nr:MFS transporter [Streptomyces sp. TRM76130]